MRLVKTIAGKFFHKIEDGFRKIGVNISLNRPFGKQAALLCHLIWVFLTHRFAQNIGTAKRVIAKHLGNLHHLFLIKNNAIGVGQYRCELWMWVHDFRAAVLSIDKIVNHTRLQRPRTKQRDEGDNVFKAVGHLLLDKLLHAPRFKLKNRRCLSALEKLVDALIVQLEMIDIEFRSAFVPALIDHFHRPIDDRKSAQP